MLIIEKQMKENIHMKYAIITNYPFDKFCNQPNIFFKEAKLFRYLQ